MRVLMFGWSSRHISPADWVTASFGLTKGMSTLEDLEVIFVVPKHGRRRPDKGTTHRANKVPVHSSRYTTKALTPIERLKYPRKLSRIPTRNSTNRKSIQKQPDINLSSRQTTRVQSTSREDTTVPYGRDLQVLSCGCSNCPGK